jgi:hypothetical protein
MRGPCTPERAARVFTAELTQPITPFSPQRRKERKEIFIENNSLLCVLCVFAVSLILYGRTPIKVKS